MKFRNKQLLILVTDQERDAFKQAADRRGVSVNAYVRWLHYQAEQEQIKPHQDNPAPDRAAA